VTRQLRTQKRILARKLTDRRHQLLRIHQAFALVPVDVVGAHPRAAAPRTVHLLPLHVALSQMPARVANSTQRSGVLVCKDCASDGGVGRNALAELAPTHFAAASFIGTEDWGTQALVSQMPVEVAALAHPLTACVSQLAKALEVGH